MLTLSAITIKIESHQMVFMFFPFFTFPATNTYFITTGKIPHISKNICILVRMLMMRRMAKLLQKTVMMTDPSVRTGRVVTGGTRSTNGISSIPRPQVSATVVTLYVTMYYFLRFRQCDPHVAREKQL